MDDITVQIEVGDTEVVAIMPDGSEWFLMSREKLVRTYLGEFNEGE